MFHLDFEDVDFRYETFMENICEDEQSIMTAVPTPVLRIKSLVSSSFTPEQVIQVINKLLKSDKKQKSIFIIMMRGLQGSGKTLLAEILAERLCKLGIKSKYVCQDSLGKEGLIKAINTCRNNQIIPIIARCHLSDNCLKIYKYGFNGMNKPFRDGDRIITFSIGTNNINTLLLSILSVIHRDNLQDKQCINSTFSYTENGEKMLSAHRDSLSRWSDDAYPEEIFGTPYMINLLNTDLFSSINADESFEEIRAAFISNGLLNAETFTMTDKILNSFIPIDIVINMIISSIISEETIIGTWKSNNNKPIALNQKKIQYVGIKVNSEQIKFILDKFNFSNFPKNAIFKKEKEDFHITLWYCAKESNDTIQTYLNSGLNTLIDKEFDIVVKSFSRNIEFARLDIELPLELVPFYKNTAPSHITLVYTEKASDAGLFEASDITFLNTTIQGTLFTYYS